MSEMQSVVNTVDQARVDLQVISDFVTPGARVLDVGCGNGDLLARLEAEKNVDGRGVELSQKGVNEAVARGLSVIQGDADHDLATYPDDAFDFVILSQTLQATYAPKVVLEALLRIGKKTIVSFPNFGHWKVRGQFMLYGRMPITHDLPYHWYDTPNIHFCTVLDFRALVREVGAEIEQTVALYGDGRRLGGSSSWGYWNAFSKQAVFLLSKP
ncbi:methionine biosynthesis protein MetW [Faunimonas pinastri]|uniref:Methionine biosynthesis protein MetW n=1 Tax=Faunimonas pinastri TaxID=1855383 RepID=A0A1H9HTV7_9HYPH|nr:methionine biosynthesis protein MetW [Faunimonas pinastri]SEQ65773.1 methionine biosynthesis protein MetW [Faunimonas pinastri]